MTALCPPDGVQLHASCVSLPQGGVLLMGQPGRGKSDLALRLIDTGGVLVADDRVNIVADDGKLLAFPPPPLEGMLEVRGIGVLTLPFTSHVPLKLAVNLDGRKAYERLPEPEFFDCLGLQVPLVSLDAFEGSTGAKIRLFLQQV